jgi:zinc and cadmium transporter
MATYAQIIFFSLIGGLFSLAGGVLLLSSKKRAKTLALYGTPFAAGALLSAVFLDLLKDGLEEASVDQVMAATLMGILIFFFAERFLHWFHHHHQHEHADPSVPLIIIGDTVHNALDGVAIAAAFLVSVPTGIITTIAVAAHEIPQEIGDFGLLLSKGMSRGKVLLVNILSALATTITAVITFALGKESGLPIGVLLGLSAGFLLYISMSDIIPTIHEKATNKRLLELQPLLMLLGASLVAISIQLAHNFIGHEEPETKATESYIHIDAEGIPHGDPGHDHGTMNKTEHAH